jgi:hypothetical protein
VVDDENTSWFGVRCLFQLGGHDPAGTSYEERVTIWRAASFDQAIAEAEAAAHVGDSADTGNEHLGLLQVHAMPEPAGHGAEVFSLIRDSDLAVDDHVDRFFDTGRERQQPA